MGVLSWQASLLGLMLFAGVGCVPTFDDNLSIVEQSKVLAVQAEPAEAAPGEDVQLTALAATPRANGAAPKLTWGLCVARKPLTELGPVNPVCVQAPSQAPDSILALGSGPSVKATLPMDACRLFGPSLPAPMNGEPAGRPVDADPTGGFYQPIGVTLLETAVTTLGAVRIFCPPSGLDQEQAGQFNQSYRRNQNPSIDSIALLGASSQSGPVPEAPDALQLAAGESVQFEASWALCSEEAACNGAESYVVFNPDSRQLDPKHESIRVSWYATDGHFDNAVTGRDEDEFALNTTDNTWTAPSEAGQVQLWLVIRDARGGQSFRSFLVTVR